MSHSLDETSIGAKIDALLKPFLDDEARLTAQLEGLKAQITALQEESRQAEHDLSVIRRSRIEAVREAAKSDPILSALFTDTSPSEDSTVGEHGSPEADADDDDEPVLELCEEHEANGVDRHPLLSPAD